MLLIRGKLSKVAHKGHRDSVRVEEDVRMGAGNKSENNKG